MKKKFKSIIGGILASAMLFGIIPATAGAEGLTYDGDLKSNTWYSTEFVSPTTTADTRFAELTTSDARSGDVSMAFRLENKATYGYMSKTQHLASTLTQGKKYRIGMWTKGFNPAKATLKAYVDVGDMWAGGAEKGYGWTYRYAVDGWTYFTRDFTHSFTGGTTYLRFVLDSDGSFLMDDVTLYEIVTEDNAETADIDETVLGTTNYVRGGDFENFTVTGLTEGYNLEVWDAFWGNLNGLYYGKPIDENLYVGSAEENKYLTKTDKFSRSGNYSIYAYCTGEHMTNKYIWLNQYVSLNAGTSYTMEFWAKGTGINYLQVRVRDDIRGSFTANETVDGWTRYTRTFTQSSTTRTQVGIRMEQGGVDNKGDIKVLIDDVKLYTAAAPATNLFRNGNFDSVWSPKNDALEYGSGWSTSSFGWTAEELETKYFGLTDTDARTGTKATVITADATEGNHYIILNNKLSSPLVSGQSYTISYWRKHTDNDYSKLKFAVLDGGFVNALPQLTYSKTEGEWINRKSTFTYSGGNSPKEIIFIYEGTEELMIDDVSLTDSQGKEYITDGSFEDCKTVITEELINPLSYAVCAGNALNISWTNPKNDNISIELYLDDELQSVEIDTASKAFNSVLLNGLENGKEYNIRLKATFGGTVQKEYNLTGVPYQVGMDGANYKEQHNYIGNQLSDTWRTRLYDIQGAYSNANIYLDYTDSQNTSLRMDANMPVVTPNLYAGIATTVDGLESWSEYQLSFKYKTNGVSRMGIINRPTGYTESQNWDWFEPTNGEWATAQIMIGASNTDEEYTYSSQILIVSDNMVGSLWIDDVVLTLVDGDGNPRGDNLIATPGFEYPAYTLTADFAKVINIVDEPTDVPTTKIDGAGSYKAIAKVRNVAEGDDFAATIMFAYYNNGKLVEVVAMNNEQIPEATGAAPATEYEKTFTVEEGYVNPQVKVFFWKPGTIEPLKYAYVLYAAE